MGRPVAAGLLAWMGVGRGPATRITGRGMRACVRFGADTGETWVLGPGDLVGRLWSAALCLDDPRVSEAHAMVSLRDGALHLLALRRRFAVDGRSVSEVRLAPGLVVELSEGLSLRVLDVTLPDEVLAVEGDGLPRQTLLGVCSLVAGPRPAVTPGYDHAADAWIWTDGEHWRLRARGGADRALGPGDEWTLGGDVFRAVSVALASSAQEATRAGGPGPLHLVAWYDTVEIGPVGQPPVVIGGIPARILSELVALEGPAPWETVAREVWRGDVPIAALRRSWDVNVSRLRGRLRDAGVRPDLVRSDGAGSIQLVVLDGDVVIDRT